MKIGFFRFTQSSCFAKFLNLINKILTFHCVYPLRTIRVLPDLIFSIVVMRKQQMAAESNLK